MDAAHKSDYCSQGLALHNGAGSGGSVGWCHVEENKQAPRAAWQGLKRNLLVADITTQATYFPSPVRQKKRANVRHGRRRGPKLRQRHDVLEGDVRLGADICHGYVLRRARGRGSGRVPPEDLDDDGVPPDGLRHRPLMVDLGEFPRVHLRGGEIHLLRFRHYPRR